MLTLKKPAKETAAELKRLGYTVEWKISTRTYDATDRFGQIVTIHKDSQTADATSIQKENALVASLPSFFAYDGPQEAAGAPVASEPTPDAHKTTEARRKAVSAWVRSRDAIVLRIPKEQGAEIRAAAKAAGVSVTRYVLDCINGSGK